VSRARRALGLAAVASLLLASCSVGVVPRSVGIAERPIPRPVLDLSFQVSDDLRTVSGTELIEFTPDLRVCEVVLRAWPNKPATARQGNALMLQSVRINGVDAAFLEEAAGAPEGSPGTLIEVPLPQCVEAGGRIEIGADFVLRLGEGTDERVGYSLRDGQAWFASAFPMLAYQNGVGWIRDEAVPVVGEMATTETFILRDLAITAPSRFGVAAVGEVGPAAVNETQGTVTHRFSAPALRDVSVLVGEIEIVERATSGVRVHVALPRSAADRATAWQDAVEDALRRLVAYLGPHPYDDLWVAVIPTQTEGLESTGAIQLGNISPRSEDDEWLFTHEIAHQWVYGLVGNNQARHPWMDESVVSMIQAVVDSPGLCPEPVHDYPEEARARMGLPMKDFLQFERPGRAYVEAVYSAGSDMLIEARDSAGHAEFDAALRSYIAGNAHRIASPEDFAQAFAGLPAVLSALQEGNALP